MKKTLALLFGLVLMVVLISLIPVSASAEGTGLYLVGNMNNWQTNGDYELSGTTGNYYLDTTLASKVNDSTNYVKLLDTNTNTWYSFQNANGENGNYAIGVSGPYRVEFNGSTATIKLNVANGYYLIDSEHSWAFHENYNNYQLTQNLNNNTTTEYMLKTNLNSGVQFKIVHVNNNIPTWYGMDYAYDTDNYIVGNNYGEYSGVSGSVTVYFQEGRVNDWRGHIYLEQTRYNIIRNNANITFGEGTTATMIPGESYSLRIGTPNSDKVISTLEVDGQLVDVKSVISNGYLYSGTMPDHDLNVNVAYAQAAMVYFDEGYNSQFHSSYVTNLNLSVQNGNYVIQLPNPSTVGWSAPSGQVFTGWKDNADNTIYAIGDWVEVPSIEFVYGATNKTFVPQFATLHTVTKGTITNGTVTIIGEENNSLNAFKGQTVTLSATPAEGYEFVSWNVTRSGGVPVSVTNNTFTMPDYDVTVSATFQQIPASYSITTTANANGSIGVTVNGEASATASEGQTVTLTATANAGYEFISWSVKQGETDVPMTGANTFTMPAGDVTVSANFQAVPVLLSKNLTLDGTIGITFKIRLSASAQDENHLSNYNVELYDAGTLLSDKIALLGSDKYPYNATEDVYTVTYWYPARLTGNNLTLKIKEAGDNGAYTLQTLSGTDISADGYTTSVKECCDMYSTSSAYADSRYTTLRNLAAKLKDYGAYAHAYLDNAALPQNMPAPSEADFSAYTFVRSNDFPSALKLSMFLTLDTDTAINLRFAVKSGQTFDLDGCTFECAGKTLSVKKTNNTVVVTIPNIGAKQLGTSFAVTVKNSSSEVIGSVTCSALYYGNLAMANGGEAVQLAVRALRDYYLAADNYYPAS